MKARSGYEAKAADRGLGGCGYVSDGVATVAGDLRIHP
jgi:hypothetical protein